MWELLFKIFAGFLLIYIIWVFTGGPERGAERRLDDQKSIFIDLEGTALDRASSTNESVFQLNR